MKKLGLVWFVLLLSACNTVSTQPRPANYAAEVAAAAQSLQSQGALLASDAAVMSDAELQRLLAYQVTLPPKSRIAILSLGQQTWAGWSDEFTQLNAQLETNFIAVLRASPAIYDASYLPSLLTPEKRTAPYLREAAARYQADLLFRYRTTCNTYEKYRLFGADETKAYCTVEAVVLDTRSGIVPFTSVGTETFAAKKGQDDLNFAETRRKAEMTAIAAALGRIAQDFVKFIEAPRK
jgi:hypothetical protein